MYTESAIIRIIRHFWLQKVGIWPFEAFFPCHVKCPERSEPLVFGHLRAFLIFLFIYEVFRAPPFSMGIGHAKEKSSKTESEKKLYDLNPLARFERRPNPHARCNNHVLPALGSGIYSTCCFPTQFHL